MQNSDWAKLASEEILRKTKDSLQERGIEVEIVENKAAALEKIRTLIPDGATVMSGASVTLDQLGFTDVLKNGDHPWKNLKDEIIREKNEKKQKELRKKSVSADFFLGSVHAVTEEGMVLVASNSGSQLPAYAYTSDHVIWVVGTQKIVNDMATATQRLKEYVFPLEDVRMKSVGYPGSGIGKLLILEHENVPGRIKLIFVREKLGF